MAEAKARKEGKLKDRKNKADGSGTGKEKAKAGAAAPARGEVEKEEFIAALKKRSEARFWDNDDVLLGQSEEAAGAAEPDEDGSSSTSEDDGSGADSQDDASESDGDAEARGERTIGSSGKEKGKAGGVSDMDWLRSKVGGGKGERKATESETSEGESDSEEDDEEFTEGSAKEASAVAAKKGRGDSSGRGDSGGANQAGGGNSDGEGSDEEEESGLSVGRLFVRNLPYTCTEDDLRELFGSFGLLSEVHLPVDDVKRVSGSLL